jgi:PAS domain S-box-containing protein
VFSGPIEVHGKKLLYSIVHDITERKRAELALEESRTILRTIIDSVPLWISCTDRNGIYLIANQRYSDTFNRPREQIEGAHYLEVLPPGLRERQQPLVDACLAGEIVSFDDEFFTEDGRGYCTHGIYTPLRTTQGEIVGATVAVMDVTPLKQVEEELRRTYERTRQDADTKAELLMEINHRVRNNLVAIMGLMLAEQRHAPEEGRPYVKTALDSIANRIQGMIEVHQLLSESEWAPMRLSHLTNRVIAAMFETLPAGLRVDVKVSPAAVEVSPRQAANLALVINELATNTRKYAMEGRDTAHIAVCIDMEEGWIVLEYRDDGPGYPEEVLREEQQGVGLYLLRQLVAGTLRGTLQLTNREGAVARVRIKTEEKDRT